MFSRCLPGLFLGTPDLTQQFKDIDIRLIGSF